jgi:cellulose biosynthesis protein BcsQ
MAPVITLSKLKGGSTKSTTPITLGASLAELGQRVLLVDVNAKGHVAEGYSLQAMSLERDLAGDDEIEGILLTLRSEPRSGRRTAQSE